MGERIRVLHVVPHVLAGGVERRRLYLCEHLRPHFDQQVACLTGRGAVNEAIGALGIEVHALGRRTHHLIGDWMPWVKLIALVRRFRPHVIHGAIFEGMVWGGLTGLALRVPVTLLEETSFPDETGTNARSDKTRTLIRLIASRSAGIVAVAPTIARDLIERGGIDARRVHTITNGVPDFVLASQEEIDAERKRLGFAPDAFVIGSVGRMDDHVKRFSDILETVNRARVTNPRVRGLLVGDGGDLAMLEAKAHELGVEEHVVFTGRREDRGLFFGLMDTFILSSAMEAAPLSLIEAMMARRPCIATRVGAVEDFAEDNVEALLIPPRRPDLMTERVLKLAEDAALRERLAAAARAKASRDFVVERYAEKVRALYLDKLREVGIAL